MVRSPCIDNNGMKKGAWSEDEDNKLRAFILTYGHWNWRLLPKYAGLKRCGKSCRLRWMNHLKPGVRRGNFSKEEEDLIIKLHTQLGNKWSAIAANLPGRTDNDIKNFWNTRVARQRKARSVPCEASSLEMDPKKTAAFDDNASEIKSQLDLWSDEVPSLLEEFYYPELHYNELWCSNMYSAQDLISYNEEGEGGSFDPIFWLWN